MFSHGSLSSESGLQVAPIGQPSWLNGADLAVAVHTNAHCDGTYGFEPVMQSSQCGIAVTFGNSTGGHLTVLEHAPAPLPQYEPGTPSVERQEPQAGPHAAYGSSFGAIEHCGQDVGGEQSQSDPPPQQVQPSLEHICSQLRLQLHGRGGLGEVVGGGTTGAGPLSTIAYTGIVVMPQIPLGPTPRFISMYPFSPHDGPQLFLTIQESAVNPTTSTPWSSLVPHGAENTPDLYC